MDPLLIDVPERIVTPRLVLRSPRAGDGAAINEAVCESMDRLRPWMPWAGEVPTPDQSEAVTRGAHARFVQRIDLVYWIWEHDGQGHETRLAGGTGLHRFDWSVPRFEIGYWLRNACIGQGYATEAVQALSRMAFDALGAERVEICMDARNERSWRVAERCGFSFEGVLRRNARSPDGVLRDTRVYARVRGAEEPSAG